MSEEKPEYKYAPDEAVREASSVLKGKLGEHNSAFVVIGVENGQATINCSPSAKHASEEMQRLAAALIMKQQTPPEPNGEVN